MPSKCCSKCQVFKDFSLFNKAKTGVFGLRGDCKECQSKYNKKWGVDNREKKAISSKNHYTQCQEYYIEYRKNNSDKRRNYINNRLKKDELFRMSLNLRNVIKRGLKHFNKGKYYKSEVILGCTYQEFKAYIESKFEAWMNWDNYGNPKDGVIEPNKTWDLDHIIPIASAKTSDELIKLCHYTNYQPLCSYVNRITKRDKISSHAIL